MNDLFCFSAPPIITKLLDSAFEGVERGKKRKTEEILQHPTPHPPQDVFLISVPTPVFLAEHNTRSSAVTVSPERCVGWWVGKKKKKTAAF